MRGPWLRFAPTVSIHAFREEGDKASAPSRSAPSFNPRLPGGRRRSKHVHCLVDRRFNPRLPGGRRLRVMLPRRQDALVSIHAFREEGDGSVLISAYHAIGFNPRLPGGRRLVRRVFVRPGRRFNPRLPGGRRQRAKESGKRSEGVSIHAFREEGDTEGVVVSVGGLAFQSTPSGRKATTDVVRGAASYSVSIHAFREEGDGEPGSQRGPGIQFQSTPSGRKATGRKSNVINDPQFQSTPSGRKATLPVLQCLPVGSFNPRLPGGRRPTDHRHGCLIALRFNPRLPGGRRHQSVRPWSVRFEVSIHAFREEGDHTRRLFLRVCAVSIHAFREEGDQPWVTMVPHGVKVSIHAFREEGDGVLCGLLIMP